MFAYGGSITTAFSAQSGRSCFTTFEISSSLLLRGMNSGASYDYIPVWNPFRVMVELPAGSIPQEPILPSPVSLLLADQSVRRCTESADAFRQIALAPFAIGK